MKLNIKELNKLVRNTIEEEEKKGKDKKDKACGHNQPGARHHSSKDGPFADPKEEDTCWSLYDVAPECGRTRTKAGSKKRLAISEPSKSGRRGKGKERTRKCSTNEPVKETQTILRSDLDRIIREEINTFLEIMPKKSASHKRKVRRDYDDKKLKKDRLDRLTGRTSMKDELDKQYAPLRSMGHGIFEEDIVMSDNVGDQDELKIKLYAVEALRDVLNNMSDEELLFTEEGDDERLDALYQYHKGKREKKQQLIKLKKVLCKPCAKGSTVGGIANSLNTVALALKGKLNEPPKA